MRRGTCEPAVKGNWPAGLQGGRPFSHAESPVFWGTAGLRSARLQMLLPGIGFGAEAATGPRLLGRGWGAQSPDLVPLFRSPCHPPSRSLCHLGPRGHPGPCVTLQVPVPPYGSPCHPTGVRASLALGASLQIPVPLWPPWPWAHEGRELVARGSRAVSGHRGLCPPDKGPGRRGAATVPALPPSRLRPAASDGVAPQPWLGPR